MSNDGDMAANGAGPFCPFDRVFFLTRGPTRRLAEERRWGSIFPLSPRPPTTTWPPRLQTQILFPAGIGPGAGRKEEGKGEKSPSSSVPPFFAAEMRISLPSPSVFLFCPSPFSPAVKK